MRNNGHRKTILPQKWRLLLVVLMGVLGLANLLVSDSGATASPQFWGFCSRLSLPAAEPRQVLVLHSYHQGYPWTDSIQQALTGALGGDNLELHVVYMDTKRLAEADSFSMTEEFLRRRYLATGLQFDAIITSDDPALDFMLKNRDRLFPGTPVVFLGANAFDQSRLAHVTGFTGVNEEISLRETVEALLRLRPQLGRLTVIGDSTQTGQRNLELMRALAPEYTDRIELTYLDGLEPEALVKALGQVNRQDAVLYLSYLRTPAGHSLSVAESVMLVSQNSPAPVFGCWDFLLGHGFVGGKVVHGAAQGQAAAQMVLNILDGQKPEDIPVLMTSPNQYVFDFQQLQRFNIPASSLPDGSIILNPPPPSWLDYWPWLLAGGGIILVQALFIAQLFISRSKIRRSEEALRQSEEKFKAIANYTVNWESWFGPDGRYLWVNPAVERFTGYTPTEILAAPDFREMVIAPADRDKVTEKLAEALRGNSGEGFEFRYLHKNGSVRWLNVSWQSILDSQGRPLGVRISGQDLTERKQAEESLRLQSAALNAAANAIVIIDRTGVIQWVNPAFCRQTGYSAAEAVGQNPMDLVHSGHHSPAFFQHIWDTLLAGQVWQGETISRNKDGSLYTEEQTITPLRNQQGELTHFIAIKQDVTARKALQAENQKLTEQFYQTQKMDSIGQLAGGIAHDFNNLLVPIVGFAELGLMAAPPDSKFYHHFEQIKGAGERAASLTRQILAFSRRQVLEMKLVDLNLVIMEFEKILRRLVRENITLKTQLLADLPIIKADPGQLEQILLNLVVNARDAMPDGGQLTLKTDWVVLDQAYVEAHPGAAPGPHVLLTVSDTGHGMDAATCARVFEPFFTTKPHGHGTGLGLSTVFGIVKQHGGNIWVYSELGRGATFAIYLPVAEPGDQLPPPVKESPVSLPEGGQTILVVEDEAAVLTLVSSTLQQAGYQVLEANDPVKGRQLAAAYPAPIHLLLTDVIMPGMNGWQLYQQLLAGRPDLKVMYMSGHPASTIARHGVPDEGAAFLHKPFTIPHLLQKVRAVLAVESPKNGLSNPA